MTTKNEVTGDDLKSKANSDAYRDNYDKIFKDKKKGEKKWPLAQNQHKT